MQSLEKANHLKARSGRGAGRGAAAGSGAKFFDFRSDSGELGAEVFVAAVDHFRRMDRAGPLRAERRDHHRHSGADVRAGHRDRVELRLAGDHHPVRVADDRVGSHADQPVREVDPASNIFSKNITVPVHWVAATIEQLIISDGYCGHGPSEICGM